jgi:hypothetical protein
MRLALLLMCLSSCAALKTGWARVTWTAGGVSPSVVCTTRIDAEGEVAMECRPLNQLENDLMWHQEKRRTLGGET